MRPVPLPTAHQQTAAAVGGTGEQRQRIVGGQRIALITGDGLHRRHCKGMGDAQRLAQEKAGTAALLNTMGKELGLRVEIVPTVRGGSANGQYVASRNLIQIAADADNAIDFVAAHEVTHRMQELAPEEYRAYRDHAMRYRARESGEEGAAAYVERYRAMAEEAGVKLTQEEAMDEIVADFTRDMMANGKLFENFAKENRPAAKRMLDALKAFIEKIKALFRGKETRDAAAQSAYGKDMAELEACAALWQKAYDAAAKQAQNAKTAAREGDGEGRLSIKRTSQMTLAQQLKMYYDGKIASSDAFYFGETPDTLAIVGLDSLPLAFTISDFHKAAKGKHNVPRRVWKNLNSSLENALFAFRIGDRVGIMTSDIDGDGKPLLVGIERNVSMDREPVNAIRSVYGLDNPGAWLRNQFTGGKEYIPLNKEKANAFLQTYGAYSASVGDGIRSTDAIVEDSQSDVKSKFSLKKPLEETKDLLALHNLTEKNLLDAVKLGGLPMPSIAVVKGDAGHSEFGPISFVFSKDTIDPQLFRSNKVYGYDAWTPTAPQIEYEVNEKAAGRIHDLFYRMQREKGRDFANPLYSVANTLEDELNRKGGLDKVVEPMRDDPRVMNIYLEDTGRGAVEKVMRQNVSRMDENQQEMSEFLIRELGADAVDGFRPTGNEAPIAARRRWFAEHGEALNEALRKYYEKLGLPAKDAADVVNAETNAAKTKYLLDTRKYLSGNTETVTEEVDLDATNNAIRKKVDKADYDRWLDELFKDVVKNEGIYNGKDYYTSSGNRRSFSATHYEITLENIVKAMKRGDQKGTNTFFGGQAIWGVASKDYNSIDEIKADSGRLVKMPEEEYSAIRQEYSARLAELANEIKDPAAQNDFIASDDAATAIVETLRTKRTAAAIDKELRTYPTLHIRPGTAGKVLQLFEDISNMPTGYFEAKPQRAVGFDEVLAAVIPDDTSAGARAALAQAGVKTIEYKSGDEQSRTDAVNSVEGARFQLKGFSEQAVSTALYDALSEKATRQNQLIPVSVMPRYISEKLEIGGDIYIQRDHAYENMVSKAQAIQDGRPTQRKGEDVHFHDLGVEKMTRAIMSINEPTMTISTRTKDGNPAVIMMLPEYGNNDAPLYAVLSFYSRKTISPENREIRPHVVLTIAERNFFEEGGRVGWDELIRNAIKEGRVLDFNKKERSSLSEVAQSAGLGDITDASLKKNLAQFQKEVKRFRESNHIRYQLKSATELEQEVRELKKYAAYRQRGTTDREILLSAAKEAAKAEWERKRLAEYRDAVGRLEGYEARLSANRAELTGLTLADGKKNAKRISYLKDEITKDTNRVAIVENKLKDLEDNRSLQELLGRERTTIQQQERTYLGKVEELLSGYRGLYGTMDKGEKAARDIQLPKKNSENEKISQTVRTILEAKATPEEMVPDIETLALDGKYSYEAYSDKAAIADADREIKRVGWAQALTDWKKAMTRGTSIAASMILSRETFFTAGIGITSIITIS